MVPTGKIKPFFRNFLLLLIVLLSIKEVVTGVLLGDFSAALDLLIYLLLLYLLWTNHQQLKTAVLSWAFFYLVILTGIKAGAKTLVIRGGNAWEINTARYFFDIFLFFTGLIILTARRIIFEK